MALYVTVYMIDCYYKIPAFYNELFFLFIVLFESVRYSLQNDVDELYVIMTVSSGYVCIYYNV